MLLSEEVKMCDGGYPFLFVSVGEAKGWIFYLDLVFRDKGGRELAIVRE